MNVRGIIWAVSFVFSCAFSSASYSYAGKVSSEGYLLEDLKTHKVLAQKESDHYFTPASNLKIFTAASALLILGTDFRYKTQLFYDQKSIVKNVLKGNVTLTFSGDPLLTQADLLALVSTLKAHHISRIEGNFILVTNALDDRPYADGWPWDQHHICYSGPISTINLDRNCVLVNVFATKANHNVDIPKSVQCSQCAPGEPCIINNAVTSDDANRPLILTSNHNQYTLEGCLSPHTKTEHMKLAIPDTTLYAKSLITKQLKTLGIVLRGKIIVGDNAHPGTMVAEHQSYPLRSLIRVMLKYSDNLIANALFKTAGGVYYHSQGTWQNGINAEKAVLKRELGFDSKALFIFDGSGESYYDAVTPEQMVSLLVYIQKTPVLSKVIIPALCVNGAEGTLVGRLRDYPPIIHAKTGSWRDVSALSGYVIKYNTLWAFSIFVNGMTPIEHGNAKQVDDWMRSILPAANTHPVTKTPAKKSTVKKTQGKLS